MPTATAVPPHLELLTFLSDPKLKEEWQVRGVTRDATKDSSKKLAERGVDVVSVSTCSPSLGGIRPERRGERD